MTTNNNHKEPTVQEINEAVAHMTDLLYNVIVAADMHPSLVSDALLNLQMHCIYVMRRDSLIMEVDQFREFIHSHINKAFESEIPPHIFHVDTPEGES